MPSQSAALKGRSVDKIRVPSRNGAGHSTACQDCREKRSEPVSSGPILVGHHQEGVNPAHPKQRRQGNSVFVLDKHGVPLMPTHPQRARELLKQGRAVVARLCPFTIRLKDRKGGAIQPVLAKFDPGSKTTGVALVRTSESQPGEQVVLFLAEITHKSDLVHERMTSRASHRRRRRSANLRYRAPRFLNRTRPEGWLPPSARSRLDHIATWVDRLSKCAPVTGIAVETVRFDTQALQNPEIEGAEYQQGTLAGYEVREYLLEKWGRQCAYCDACDVPLQIDHIVPRSRGGSDRVSNLTLACACCNQNKGAQDVRQFLADDPTRLEKILQQAQRPLKDAAAVNQARHVLEKCLRATGLPVFTSTGGRTKYNRERRGLPKLHCIDAACVGEIGSLDVPELPILQIKATGRGTYQRTRADSYGFPRNHATGKKTEPCPKRVHGFQTGDRVRAKVTPGKKRGVYVGRVAIRKNGYFNIQTPQGIVDSISYRYCTLLARADGYGYSFSLFKSNPKERDFLPPLKRGVPVASIL